MQCPKRPLEDQDPDYPELQPSDSKKQKLVIDKAREVTCQKIRRIINSQFEYEIKKREEQLNECQDRLYKARQNLRLLRYAVVSSYYRAQPSKEQNRIHPAVKKLLGSKTPEEILVDVEVPESLSEASPQVQPAVVDERKKAMEIMLSKQPRYIAPIAKPGEISKSPPRAANLKVKKRIVVGNVSKWIHPDFRDDASTHKWMIYVRGPPEAPDVSNLVERVRFFLHSSYKPHDVIEIKESPFHLSRRGWGEFPVRVQIHFLNPQNRPIDVIHQLVLDKTYTGLQTLGGETIVDAWILESSTLLDKKVEALSNSQNPSPEKMSVTIDEGVNVVIKEEPKSPPPANLPVCPGKSLLKSRNAVLLNGTSTAPIVIKSPGLFKSAEKKVIKFLVNPDSQFSANNLGNKIIIRPNIIKKSIAGANPKTLLTFGSKNVLQLQKTTSPKILQLADKANPLTTSLLASMTATNNGQKPVVFLKMNSEGKLVPVIAPSGQPKVIKINSASPPPLVLLKKSPQKLCINGGVALSQPARLLDEKSVLKQMDLHKKKKFEMELEQLKIRRVDNFNAAALMLMKSLPLIADDLAQDAEYHQLHPYTLKSREQFLSLPFGKQRAIEFMRAKEISNLLKVQGFDVKTPWDIARLSRSFGFTPLTDTNFTTSCIPTAMTNNIGARYSEAVSVQSWLESQSNEVREQEDSVVDVEGCQSSKNKVLEHTPKNSKSQIDETLAENVPSCNFVKHIARQIGIQLEPEQLTESTTYRSAETVIFQAALQLVDEIVRRSYCEALQKQKSKISTIELRDVRAALQQRPEFDIFSNEGVGMDFDK